MVRVSIVLVQTRALTWLVVNQFVVALNLRVYQSIYLVDLALPPTPASWLLFVKDNFSLTLNERFGFDVEAASVHVFLCGVVLHDASIKLS